MCLKHSFDARGFGLEFSVDRKPGLGGVRRETIRIIAGDFAEQTNILAKRHADHGIPFTAISDAQAGGPEIMIDQPEHCAFQRAVAAELIAKLSIDITQAICRGDEKFVGPAIEGMKRRKRRLQGRTAVAFKMLEPDFRGNASRNKTGFQQQVIVAKDQRIETIFLLIGIFCSVEYFCGFVEWLIAG